MQTDLNRQQDFEALGVGNTSLPTSVEMLFDPSVIGNGENETIDCTPDVEMGEETAGLDPAASDSTLTSMQMIADNSIKEPIRLIKPSTSVGAAPGPKRYYKRFWKGMATRIVAHRVQSSETMK
jgi:hypothetical protein